MRSVSGLTYRKLYGTHGITLSGSGGGYIAPNPWGNGIPRTSRGYYKPVNATSTPSPWSNQPDDWKMNGPLPRDYDTSIRVRESMVEVPVAWPRIKRDEYRKYFSYNPVERGGKDLMAKEYGTRGMEPRFFDSTFDRRWISPYHGQLSNAQTTNAGGLKMVGVREIVQLRNRLQPTIGYVIGGDPAHHGMRDRRPTFAEPTGQNGGRMGGTPHFDYLYQKPAYVKVFTTAGTTTGKRTYYEFYAPLFQKTIRIYYPTDPLWWRARGMIGTIYDGNDRNPNHAKAGPELRCSCKYGLHGYIPLDKDIVKAWLICRPGTQIEMPPPGEVSAGSYTARVARMHYHHFAFARGSGNTVESHDLDGSGSQAIEPYDMWWNKDQVTFLGDTGDVYNVASVEEDVDGAMIEVPIMNRGTVLSLEAWMDQSPFLAGGLTWAREQWAEPPSTSGEWYPPNAYLWSKRGPEGVYQRLDALPSDLFNMWLQNRNCFDYLQNPRTPYAHSIHYGRMWQTGLYNQTMPIGTLTRYGRIAFYVDPPWGKPGNAPFQNVVSWGGYGKNFSYTRDEVDMWRAVTIDDIEWRYHNNVHTIELAASGAGKRTTRTFRVAYDMVDYLNNSLQDIQGMFDYGGMNQTGRYIPVRELVNQAQLDRWNSGTEVVVLAGDGINFERIGNQTNAMDVTDVMQEIWKKRANYPIDGKGGWIAKGGKSLKEMLEYIASNNFPIKTAGPDTLPENVVDWNYRIKRTGPPVLGYVINDDHHMPKMDGEEEAPPTMIRTVISDENDPEGEGEEHITWKRERDPKARIVHMNSSPWLKVAKDGSNPARTYSPWNLILDASRDAQLVEPDEPDKSPLNFDEAKDGEAKYGWFWESVDDQPQSFEMRLNNVAALMSARDWYKQPPKVEYSGAICPNVGACFIATSNMTVAAARSYYASNVLSQTVISLDSPVCSRCGTKLFWDPEKEWNNPTRGVPGVFTPGDGIWTYEYAPTNEPQAFVNSIVVKVDGINDGQKESGGASGFGADWLGDDPPGYKIEIYDRRQETWATVVQCTRMEKGKYRVTKWDDATRQETSANASFVFDQKDMNFVRGSRLRVTSYPISVEYESGGEQGGVDNTGTYYVAGGDFVLNNATGPADWEEGQLRNAKLRIKGKLDTDPDDMEEYWQEFLIANHSAIKKDGDNAAVKFSCRQPLPSNGEWKEWEVIATMYRGGMRRCEVIGMNYNANELTTTNSPTVEFYTYGQRTKLQQRPLKIFKVKVHSNWGVVTADRIDPDEEQISDDVTAIKGARVVVDKVTGVRVIVPDPDNPGEVMEEIRDFFYVREYKYIYDHRTGEIIMPVYADVQVTVPTPTGGTTTVTETRRIDDLNKLFQLDTRSAPSMIEVVSWYQGRSTVTMMAEVEQRGKNWEAQVERGAICEMFSPMPGARGGSSPTLDGTLEMVSEKFRDHNNRYAERTLKWLVFNPEPMYAQPIIVQGIANGVVRTTIGYTPGGLETAEGWFSEQIERMGPRMIRYRLRPVIFSGPPDCILVGNIKVFAPPIKSYDWTLPGSGSSSGSGDAVRIMERTGGLLEGGLVITPAIVNKGTGNRNIRRTWASPLPTLIVFARDVLPGEEPKDSYSF